MRSSFFSLALVGFIVLTVSCSKKDVKSDEPGFSPSEGAAASPDASVNAGEASTPAPDMATIYFAFDSFTLSGEGRDALKSNADWLRDNPTATVQIEGHCDERGTTEYNLALGEKRANSVKNYLTKMGVDSSRLSVISYGEERPAVSGHDEAAWAQNRRAAFVVLSR